MGVDVIWLDKPHCYEFFDQGMVAGGSGKTLRWTIEVSTTVTHVDNVSCCAKDESSGHGRPHPRVGLVMLIECSIGTLHTYVQKLYTCHVTCLAAPQRGKQRVSQDGDG